MKTVPSICGSGLLLTAAVCTPLAVQARVYDQRENAVAPGGLDLHRGMALTNHFLLQVVGPDDIRPELVKYAQECAGAAITSGVIAAEHAPGEVCRCQARN